MEVAPLLKWPGGKRRLVKQIWAALLHGERRLTAYVEPFLGSGAVYLGRPAQVRLTSASLSDVNRRLIRFHWSVANDPESLATALEATAHVPWPSGYDAMRRCLNDSDDPAVLCWINRACFNGLYRENRAGEFNAPIGASLGALPTRSAVRDAHAAMHARVDILTVRHESYFDALRRVLASPCSLDGVGIYLDPPYVVEATAGQGCSGFTAYSAGGFGLSDHLELVKIVKEAASRGARVVMSGSSGWLTEQIYLGAHSALRVHEVLSVTRSIGPTSRKRATEWLFIAG